MKPFVYLFNLLVALSVLLYSSDADSQTYKSSKRFRPGVVVIEFMPSYSSPVPSMYGSISDFFAFKNYGVNSGLGTHLNFKFSANKQGNFKPMATIGYNLFFGSDANNAYIETNNTKIYPNPNKTYTGIPGTSDIYLHNFRFGVGAAYEFLSKKNLWVPFIGMTIDGNFIFGTYRQTPYSVPPGYTGGRVSFTIKQAFRVGFSIGSGINFRMTKAFGFLLNTNFRYSNLFNKQAAVVNEENKMHLLDESDANLNKSLTKDRALAYFDFGLGVVFYIGRK